MAAAAAPAATRRSPGASRKRALARAGLAALALQPRHAHASPLRQHRVPPAAREVPYWHSLTGAARRLDPFYVPPRHGEAEPAAAAARGDATAPDNSAGRRLGEAYARPSGVLADAAREHPDHVFRRLRDRARPAPAAAVGPAVRRRAESRQSQTDDFLTQSRTYQQVTSTTVSGAARRYFSDFVNANVDGESASNVTDFNVSAATRYDVPLTVGANGTADRATVLYTDSDRLRNATSARDARFHPIRIRAFLLEAEGGGQFLTNDEHDRLLQDVVKPALLAWSAALRVDSVRGRLTVDRSQLIDGASCGPGLDSGLPSAAVPLKHIDVGVEETDLIVYLDLGFVSTNRTVQHTVLDPDLAPDPAGLGNLSSYLGDLTNFTSSSIADFLAADKPAEEAFKRANGPQKCSGEYLAASSFCSTDQYDRPTAAILHLCIGEDFFAARNVERNVMTVMHELGHALGFNSVSLAHFRRSDGNPITPRVNGAVPEVPVLCTGPEGYGRQHATIPLPSEEILQFRTVRGGVRVAEVVTPSVRQVVRNHFDCQDLPGAELESGEFLPLYPNSSFCVGDHWERRLLKMDIMNPVTDDLVYTPRISTITLAYFADSGWYQVDLSRATHAAGWGRGAGCPFIESACIDPDGHVPDGYEAYFCNESLSLDAGGFATQIHGCTPDFTKKASCSMGQYSGSLPFEYQYFNVTYGSNVGGSDPYMDYCPVFDGFTNGLCADPENEALIRVDRVERIGDRNSRCIAGTRQAQHTALCLRIACVLEDQSFRIQVDGVWHPCARNGDVIISQSGDRIICPDPVRICPTFYCVLDCLGTKRICDYEQGKCVCNEALLQDLDCDGELDDPFYDPGNQTNMPDFDSPLADYYVPTARQLMVENVRFNLDKWEIVAVTFGTMLILLLAYLIWGHLHQASDDDAGNDSPGDSGSNIVNPDKHKMMASVVVDLRMNDQNLRSGDALDNRASETDQSMTETDGGGSHVSNLSMEIDAVDEDTFPPIDPSDPLPSPNIVRRRGKQCFSE